MAREGQNAHPPEFRPGDEVDEVFEHANPNPDRIGCPPADILRALARKERPLGDPAYDHLAKCSPCYRDFRQVQQESRRPAISRRLLAIAAAVLLVVGASLYFVLRRTLDLPEYAGAVRINTSQQQVVLDLRAYSVTRSDEQNRPEPPLQLLRSNLDLNILLPVGSEPGTYEMRVLDQNLQSRLSKQVTAEMKNFAATIETNLDLRSIDPGLYQLAIRRVGEEWRLYPAHLE